MREDKSNEVEQINSVAAIGIDLAEDYAQLCYYKTGETEPVSYSSAEGEEEYLVPLIMYKMHNVEQWYIGEEAKFRSYEDDDERYTVSNLFELIHKEKSVKIDENEYTGEKLLEIFVGKLVEALRSVVDVTNMEYVTVTVDDDEREIVKMLYSIMKKVGFPEEKTTVINHTESFIYYVLSQKKDIWVNDVVLFDFSSKHFEYRKLSITRNRQPNVVSVTKENYSEEIDITYMRSDTDKKIADEKLLLLIKNLFYKQIISSVFLTGIGFYEDFAPNSLIELCSKRRVFKGYNLFVKGSCYCAMEKGGIKDYSSHTFFCEGRTKANIGLMINHQGKNTGITLSKAGTGWYDAGAKVECILDNTNVIQVLLASPYGDYTRNVKIDLSELPVRPNKTTRVSVSLAYVNENECRIVIEDLGFGDFYKASGKIIEETILIDDIEQTDMNGYYR